ncbi:MAG: hypothetical protein NWF01_01555 [Candidatus Bathyarchaeota archaeon]|nr:hypothetical protein [Candidatus Bathyarchaeota archaeon]
MSRVLSTRQSTGFFLLLQAVGVTFFVLFSAAYWIPFQTKNLLHAEPFFHWALSITGGVFLLLVLIAVVLCFVAKPQRVEA